MRSQSTRARKQPPVLQLENAGVRQHTPSIAINKYFLLICKSRRQWRKSVSKTKIVVLGNLTTEATSQHLCCILLVGSKLQISSQGEGGYTRVSVSRSKDHWGHLRNCLQCRIPRFDPWVRKIPWRREWQPTLLFLPIKFHEQRSLADYSTRGCKELDTTEQIILKVNPCKSVLRIMLLY